MDTNKQIVSVKKDVNSFLVVSNGLLEKANALSITKIEDTQSGYGIVKQCQKIEKEIEEKRLSITKPLNDFIEEVNILFKETKVPLSEAKNTTQQKILAFEHEQERLRKLEEERLLALERKRLKKLEKERQLREQEELKKREAEEAKLQAERERLQKLDNERLEKEIASRKLEEKAKQELLEQVNKQRVEREKLEIERLEMEREKREIEEEKKRIEEDKKIQAKKQAMEEMIRKQEEADYIKGITKIWTYEIVDENLIPKAFCSPDSKKINKAIKSGIIEISGLKIYKKTLVK